MRRSFNLFSLPAYRLFYMSHLVFVNVHSIILNEVKDL